MKLRIALTLFAIALPFVTVYISTALVSDSIGPGMPQTNITLFRNARNTIWIAAYTSWVISGITLLYSCFYHEQIKKAKGLIISIICFMVAGTVIFFGSLLFLIFSWLHFGGME